MRKKTYPLFVPPTDSIIDTSEMQPVLVASVPLAQSGPQLGACNTSTLAAGRSSGDLLLR